MLNLNKVFLAGRLTRDPQLRFTPSGTPVADFGLAINRVWNDASGQRREETCFVDVTVWRRQAEVCHKHLKKGRAVLLEGRLTLDTWEGQDGQKRSRLRVVAERIQFIDWPGESQGQVPETPEPEIATQEEETIDDIPF